MSRLALALLAVALAAARSPAQAPVTLVSKSSHRRVNAWFPAI